MKAIEMIGHTFGQWSVKGIEGDRIHGAKLVCRCSCGEERAVARGSLLNGRSTSCGHNKVAPPSAFKTRTLPGASGFNRILKIYQNGAQARSLEWRLSAEEFRSLTIGACHYCGEKPKAVSQWKYAEESATKHSAYVYNGVDRVDNNGGYTIENCVPCCKMCNKLKSNHSVGDLFQHLQKMVTHFNKAIS